LKIQNKAASTITFFGIVIVILFTLGYDLYIHRIIIDEGRKNLKNLSEEVALNVGSRLKEKTAIAITLSSAPIIRDALLRSNSEFAALPGNKRKQEIVRRNKQWMKTSNINDTFIKARTENPVAGFLKHQQEIMPEEYGEIFLTNRYGVMIAATAKLTTLAHAHKYWWQACYDDGQGRIFLDDRGFDASAQGYVIGVVVPIKYRGRIIGIMKSNVNIMGPLTDVVRNFGLRHPGRMRIVRTGGLVVSEHGVTPLSIEESGVVIKMLIQKDSGTAIITENNESHLVAYSPVPITMGSEQFGFGGSKVSIDHIKGNIDEAWHVVITLSEKESIESAHDMIFVIIIVGIVFTFLTAVVALLFGKWIAGPIVELVTTAQSIGEGHLDTRVEVFSNDETGTLAKTLNKMTENLQNTMASRDELETANRKLQDALDSIQTLSGLVPICAKCKKIRDDKGFWNQIEGYIETHSEAIFSHGLCPKCEEELYGDQEWYKKMKQKK